MSDENRQFGSDLIENMDENSNTVSRQIRNFIPWPRLLSSSQKKSSSTANAGASSSSSSRFHLNPNWKNSPTIVVMVGLPARGKTYISTRLSRYLNWVGINTKVFNVGQYRRNNSKQAFQGANFFDPNNTDAMKMREKWRKAALDDIIKWIHHEDGAIAIYDATNIARCLRNDLYNFAIENGVKMFFVESECNDPLVIQTTVREVKLHGPDYLGCDVEQAERDFNTRIDMYSKIYDPMCSTKDEKMSFIKLIDVGKSYIVNRIQDHIQSRMVYFLMNIKVRKSAIYLCRHGESIMNVEQCIGGDSSLSNHGKEFAVKLGEFMKEQPNDTCVWTSELKRTQQTAGFAGLHYEPWKALNEIDAGVCEGMSYEEIKSQYPEEYERRNGASGNKYSYRYPMGESYYDLVIRLEPVIMELERSDNVLVICHQAVIRCLLAYFRNEPPDDLPYMRVPLHTVIKLTQHAHACNVEYFAFDVEGVETYNPRPQAINS